MSIQSAAFSYVTNAQGPWLKLEWYEAPFNVTAFVSLDGTTAGTFSLSYIPADWSNRAAHEVNVSQAVNTITVGDSGPRLGAGFGDGLGHGLAIGDAVELDIPGGQTLFTVATVTNANVYTVTSGISQSYTAQNVRARTGQVMVAGAAGDKIIGANGAGITVRTALPINAPIFALQLNAGTLTTPGVARLTTLQGDAGT